jgi:pseudaminic acid cytidylyltransferase
MKRPKILAIIPARGGSKRIPKKNIKEFCGKPMIAWPILTLQASGLIDDIIVSTDSSEIQATVESLNVKSPFLRPPELSDDNIGTGPVIKHAAEWYIANIGKPDLILTVYPSAVFISPADIEKAVKLLLESDADSLTACGEYEYPIQRALFLDKNNRIEMFSPQHLNTRSQDLELAYHDAGQLYLSNLHFIMDGSEQFLKNSIMFVLPRHKVVDIDTPEDYEFAERLFLLEQEKKKMHRIAIGTAQFGLDYGIANKLGQVDIKETNLILQAANSRGVDTLDTSISYGIGEENLGNIGVGNYKVVTKLPQIPIDVDNIHEWAYDQIQQSLERLNLHKVYGLLVHNASDFFGLNGVKLAQALVALREEGLVQKVGVSVYEQNELASIFGKFQIDIIQIPFNIFDRRMLSSGWLQRLNHAGIEIHARSIFLQGLLLMPMDEVPDKFLKWAPLLKFWHKWLNENNTSALKTCLHYPLSLPQIDKVIVGVDNHKQLNEIFDAFDPGNRPFLFPDIACEDELLLNPSNWPLS